jgi:hypothetical protein
MMTKKDYKVLASMLKNRQYTGDLEPCVLSTICDFCRLQNPRFDERKFREAVTGIKWI